MIQSYKNKFSSRPVPAIDFDNFLKIRSEKQSIIQVPLFIIPQSDS